MHIRTIDQDFAVIGQILPDQMPAVVAAGFRSIVCARPDDEDPGQPSFGEVALAAQKAGVEIVHVPVTGMLSQSAFMRFEEAMKALPRPVLGYCRSGGRAASLYAKLQAS